MASLVREAAQPAHSATAVGLTAGLNWADPGRDGPITLTFSTIANAGNSHQNSSYLAQVAERAEKSHERRLWNVSRVAGNIASMNHRQNLAIVGNKMAQSTESFS
jgi:hypothetical protein